MSPGGDRLPADLTGLPYSADDMETISRAYAVAAYWHRDQWRKSGDPYVTHSVAVARILADLGMDAASVCAGLLHDVPDDTPCPPDQLRMEFGDEIMGIVGKVLELDSLRTTSVTTVLEAAEPRVLAVKLADRLHNMQTLRHVGVDKQERKSRETLELFAPVAAHLGLDTLKRQLEDLALATLYPQRWTQAHEPERRDMKILLRILSSTAALLPSAARGRWLEEWSGELHALQSRRQRVQFTLQLMYGLPRLAVTLRRQVSRSPSGLS